ncbi:MAG: decaprenylphospho-beta-D-erythro-pentofuranosid-2-ulose 2-reductase [Myxococcota bacterium]|jgi:decaprenylphospho-beta-D-erythro-pentofuranosid-2-ulose 2-reductase
MSAVVFGATSRIAQQLCQRLAEGGHSVAVAARDLEEAERIAADLRVRHQVDAIAIAFDAIDTSSHPALIEAIEKQLGPIEMGVLAFGDMGEQSASEGDFTAARRVIDVNYTGAASLAEAMAGPMSERGRGTIVGIASVAGDRGRQSNYVYGSAKGAFALYLQGLRNRLFKAGVHVMTVKLGFVDTRMTFGMQTKIPVASPEASSHAIIRAARRKTDTLYYPPFWRGIMGVIRGIPERAFKRLSL